MDEAFPKALKRALDAEDVDDVVADADDHQEVPLRTLLAAGLCARPVHGCAHAANCAVESAEDSLADQKMTNVELNDVGDTGNRPDTVKPKAVSGVAFEA